MGAALRADGGRIDRRTGEVVTAADSLAAFTHAVELVALMRGSTRDEAVRIHRKVAAAYVQVHGAEHADEVARQVAVIVEGAAALRTGVEP